MARSHLFEFGDQPWLPVFLRDGMTDYLRFAMRVTGHDKLVMAPILAALRVEAVLEPTDARAVPQGQPGLRMMVNAFHHLRPDDARAVLEAAHRDRQPILIVELVGRELPFLLGMLGTPLISTLTAPLWKPFRLTNLLFTWLIPLIQPLIAFDGVVSCLRSQPLRPEPRRSSTR